MLFDSKSKSMRTFNMLQKGLGAATVRHKTIANNIANINTPEFKRSVVSFESELKRALEGDGSMKALRVNPRHIRFKRETGDLMEVQPEVIMEDDTIFRNDKNNVDLDVEMANLAKNTLLYEGLVVRVKGKLFSLRQIINIGA